MAPSTTNLLMSSSVKSPALCAFAPLRLCVEELVIARIAAESYDTALARG
jgi:hypothetical protein